MEYVTEAIKVADQFSKFLDPVADALERWQTFKSNKRIVKRLVQCLEEVNANREEFLRILETNERNILSNTSAYNELKKAEDALKDTLEDLNKIEQQTCWCMFFKVYLDKDNLMEIRFCILEAQSHMNSVCTKINLKELFNPPPLTSQERRAFQRWEQQRNKNKKRESQSLKNLAQEIEALKALFTKEREEAEKKRKEAEKKKEQPQQISPIFIPFPVGAGCQHNRRRNWGNQYGSGTKCLDCGIELGRW